MTEARVQVVVRLSATGVEQLDRIAEQEERTRSQVIRMLLREALEARARPERERELAVIREEHRRAIAAENIDYLKSVTEGGSKR